MNSDPIPLIFGEVLFDCFEDGSNVLGGAPFNVAWHLNAFGLDPLLISRVGDDPLGRQIRSAMQDWGMSTAGLQLDSSHPTGRVQVSLRNGEPSFDILPDAAYDYIQPDAIPPVAPGMIYHGSLALRNQASADTLEAIKQLYPVPVFVDINLRPPWWDRETVIRCLDAARWVKLNENELAILVASPGNVRSRGRILLQEYGLSLAIITRGGEGALALTDQGQAFEITPEKEMPVVDTVGAGDAFASACILGLTAGWPLERTLSRAQEFASQVVGKRGATVADRSFYQPFLEHWEG